MNDLRDGPASCSISLEMLSRPVAFPLARFLRPIDISVGEIGASLRRSFWAWEGPWLSKYALLENSVGIVVDPGGHPPGYYRVVGRNW